MCCFNGKAVRLPKRGVVGWKTMEVAGRSGYLHSEVMTRGADIGDRRVLQASGVPSTRNEQGFYAYSRRPRFVGDYAVHVKVRQFGRAVLASTTKDEHPGCRSERMQVISVWLTRGALWSGTVNALRKHFGTDRVHYLRV